MNLNEFLKIFRKKRRITIKDMAAYLDISSSYLSAISKGKRNIPSDFEDKIIKVYSLNEEEQELLSEAIINSAFLMNINLSDLDEKRRKLVYLISKEKVDNLVLDKMCELIDKDNDL